MYYFKKFINNLKKKYLLNLKKFLIYLFYYIFFKQIFLFYKCFLILKTFLIFFLKKLNFKMSHKQFNSQKSQ
jgi:hypothetical protein